MAKKKAEAAEERHEPPPSKPLAWLHSEIKTPPFSLAARLKAGFLLRKLQDGELLSMLDSRPMPSIGKRCHELRVRDGDLYWRIVYRIDRLLDRR